MLENKLIKRAYFRGVRNETGEGGSVWSVIFFVLQWCPAPLVVRSEEQTSDLQSREKNA